MRVGVQLQHLEDKFTYYFNKKIPTELLPLPLAIDRTIKEAFPEYYVSRGRITVKRTHLLYSHSRDKYVVITMMPTRRIEGLEHIRNGTMFTITDVQQVIQIIRFLQKN